MAGNDLVIKDHKYLNFLKKLELVTSHIHIDGSLPAKEIFKRTRELDEPLHLPEKNRNGKRIKYDNPKDRVITSATKLQKFMTNLREYNLLDVFNMTVRFIQTEEDFFWATGVFCEYLKSQNIIYAEARFAPQYHRKKGLSYEDAIRCAIDGLQKATDETGVDVRLIISIGREAHPDISVEVAKAAIKCNKNYPRHVLGIDLACEEGYRPPRKHYKAFKETFDTPLKRTVHAGEMCSEGTNRRNILEAITLLRADALSHAIHLYKDKLCQDLVLERKIRIESNPISNHVFFDYWPKDLHLDELIAAGVLVTINPDDPAMIKNGDLVHNLYHLGKLYGDGFVKKVIANSIQAAWGLSREQKQQYLSEIN